MPTTDGKTQLEIMGEQQRLIAMARNTYNESNRYGVDNLNALSNGDEKGKGEYNGQVGTLTDNLTRNDLTVKNTYNEKKSYPDFTV